MLGDDNKALSRESIASTARQIQKLAEAGVQVAVVVGGGNILRGRSSEGMERNRADHMGMLATAINALAIQDALENIGVNAVVFSAVEMQRFCDTFSSREANAALDALILAKSVDAVYSADPNVDLNAVRYSELTYDKVIADNLKATDITTITLCRDYKMPIVLFSMEDETRFLRALEGENVGTVIS